MVARLCDEWSVFAKKITGLTNRTDHVVTYFWCIWPAWLDGLDSLPRSIERWAEQIIHGGVNHTEVLSLGYFCVQHASEQKSSISNDRASRLQY